MRWSDERILTTHTGKMQGLALDDLVSNPLSCRLQISLAEMR